MNAQPKINQSNPEDIFGPAIASYSRAQAIEDGVLVDVSTLARECGFKFPVAMTRAAWSECVEIPKGVTCQDETGRLWDVLNMLRVAIKRSTGGDRVDFELVVRNHNGRMSGRDLVKLYSICGPGDSGEPAITIMQPNED